jgi:two-component system, OmpR family, phosphate regulon response regulator PhoB
MAKILVVEDEADLQQVLKFNLQQAGYSVRVTASGTEALRIAAQEPPTLILLDVMLPDILGTEVCRMLKSDPETTHVPIIMLTARGTESDRVVGFELGADDYVTKPFSVRELMLRVSAILKRSSGTTQEHGKIEFGVLTIDSDAHRVWVSEQEIDLSALEFRLLVALYERKNRVQSRTSLLDDVWGVTADVTTRTVDTHVKRLREKLGNARNYVETVRGVGYRFVETPDEARVGE